jgi:hypothetical protein
VGEYLGFGGPADYATGMMEEVRLGSSVPDYTTLGFENPEYGGLFDTSNTLYDAPTYTWPASQIISRLNGNYHVFNHMGHGAAWVCFKLNLSLAADKLAVANLTNSVYYLSYSQACEPGRFDDRTDCFAEQLVTSRAGAFAAVMNPRYGWGFQNSVDGPSQRFHRRFWDAVFARGRYHLGVMNQDSKERNRYLVNTVGSGDPMRWCYYEITLFGDPATPFAARILKFAPTFVHTPLNNQYTTQGVYRIDCTMGPVGLYEPTSPRVVWQSSGSPGTVHTNLLSRCSGSRYEGAIPAQPTGARISYRLLADTLAGEAGQWPASGDHLFDVTPPVSLTVQGQPAPYGVVTPAYGTSLIASGTVISAAAPVRLETAPGVSQAQAGWTGSGCVPATGTSNQVSFALTVPSTLNWQWTTEFALQQRSSLAGLIASNSWHRPGTIADSMIAPATISQSGKTYAFCGWYLDGLRQPTAPSPVINPVAGVVLSTNRLLSALYVTTIQDLDGNGIPDWWEYSFFGTNGVPPATDIDGDGFGAGDEYRDRTNPTDPSSRPAPPAILLSPLASPQAMPPPYAVSVTLTDSYAIASATLRWRRNGGTWQSAALASRGSGVYTGTIPAPGVPADVFDYNLIATDPAGHAATTAVYSVWLQYPRVAFGPAQGRDLVLLPSGVDYALLAITNTGNARLNWSLARGSHEVVTPGASGWRTNAYGQVWRASSTRSFSPPYAFSAHLTSGGSQNFTPPVHACLESPALQLASRARLFFRHWVKTELDSVAGYCYDGGVVEISTNAGVSFVQLPGPYTHKIHGWTYSPWLNDTPCFAGNGSAGWVEVSFDLAAYAGQTVLLRFHYGADNNTDDEGWYVDDIRVGPLSSPIWPDWAVCGATAGSLVGGGKVTFPFDTDASLAVLRDDRLAVHLLSNDPVTPNVYVDWTLKIREPPLIDGPWAWQSSTNGEGLVTLRLNVADRDGEAVDLQVDCSTNAGATWFAPTLTGTSVSLGQAPAGVVTGQIAHLVTTDAGGMRSNVVSTVWPTRIPMPGIALAPAARMRVRGSNPYFASDYRTSAAFVIDNQQPTQPTGLLLSHTPQTWTPATAFSASWEPASDGAGIGGLRYRRRLAADTAAPAAPSQAALTFSGVVPEGSNTWFAVQAVDAFGNAGAIVRRGPFWVDATPPASASARAWVASSDAGPYAVGTNVLFSWEGFGDALSGIAGYRAHNVAAPVASETTATHLVLPAQPVGVTNGFGVAAFDRAGNVSPWVLAHVLVLDPLADPDGDGMLTRDEEVAGTDARAADQLFMIGMSTDLGTLVVQWTGRSGRTYTVDRTPTLAPVDWSPVPAHTGIPGSNGLMRAIVPRDLTVGFFRVRVSR